MTLQTLLCGSLPSSQGKADGDDQKDEPQTPGLDWVGSDLKDYLIPTPPAVDMDILQSIWEN